MTAAALLVHLGGGSAHGHLNYYILAALGVLAVVYYAVHGLGLAVSRAVTRAVGQATGMKAVASAVEVPLRRGELVLNDVRIGSRHGPADRWLVRVGRCAAPLTAGSLLGDVVDVRRIELHDVALRLDGRPELGAMLRALERLGTGSPVGAEEGRRYAVAEVVASGITAQVTAPPAAGSRGDEGAATVVAIPELRMERPAADRDGGAGIPLPRLAGVIVAALLEAAANEADTGR